MGKYIDCAKAEPLHLKNNVIKEQFMKIFKIFIAKSDLRNATSYIHVPPDSPFVSFVEFLP